MKPSRQQKDEAARHLAVAHALLHGCKAELGDLPTSIEINGRDVQVQVAAQGAWPIENLDSYLKSTVEVVVLVDIRSAFSYYIVPGDDLRALVRRRHEEFMERVEGQRSRNPGNRHLRIGRDDVRAWKDRWSVLE